MDRAISQTQFDGKDMQFQRVFDSAIDGMMIIDLESSLIVESNPAACQMHGYKLEEITQLQVTAMIHPDYQYGFNEHFRTFKSDGEFDILTLQARRDGSTFFAEWRGSAFPYEDCACLLVIIRDVSKRIQVEQLLHQREETRAYEQAKLLEISHTLASTLEFKPGLMLDKLKEIINYNIGGLFGLEDSTVVTLAMRGTTQLEQSKPFHIQLKGRNIQASLFNERQPVRIADIWSETPQAIFLRGLLGDGANTILQGMHSSMCVPLAVEERIIGGLGLAHEKHNYFTQHHADLALSAANQAAITMMNVELYGNAKKFAIMEERQRLARNLHDAVNQSLFSAGLIAEVLPRLWERDQEEARRSIEDLIRLTRGAQAEMRALLAELRPSTLIDSNLNDLVRLLGNALSGRTNIPVIVKATPEIILPSEVQVTFYRICQEALFNVAKHTKASLVEINLHQEGDFVELRIRDDGQGFDPTKIISGHYGLTMMRERAEAVGASLSITSQSGQGTELIIHWTKVPRKEFL